MRKITEIQNDIKAAKHAEQLAVAAAQVANAAAMEARKVSTDLALELANTRRRRAWISDREQIMEAFASMPMLSLDRVSQWLTVGDYNIHLAVYHNAERIVPDDVDVYEFIEDYCERTGETAEDLDDIPDEEKQDWEWGAPRRGRLRGDLRVSVQYRPTKGTRILPVHPRELAGERRTVLADQMPVSRELMAEVLTDALDAAENADLVPYF